jgi:hypothetical protein
MRLTTGLKERSCTELAGLLEPHWTCARFRIRHQGRPSRQWAPVQLTLSDATGNAQTSSWRSAVMAKGDETHFHFDRTLSPDESAWKLRIEFSRTARAKFSPAETWTVRGLSVPQRDSFTLVDAAAIRDGVKLVLRGIAGTGHTPWPDGGPIVYWVPTVRILATGLREGQRLMLRAVDDRGRLFAGYDAIPSEAGSAQDFRFKLNLPSDAKKVDLTFAVHQSRFVELLAKPSLP